MPKIATTTTTKKGGLMFGFDLHWWETAMLVSLGLAAIAAGAVGVATTAVVMLQRQEVKSAADELAQYKVDAGLKISEAATVAASANAASAKANERAAQAEARAAEANLELAKFKAPRTLDKEKQKRISEKLKPKAGARIDIFKFGDSIEIFDLAEQIVSSLNEAEWSVQMWVVSSGGAASGINILARPGSNDDVKNTAQLITSCLNDAGIPTEECLSPPEWGDWSSLFGFSTGPTCNQENIAPIRMAIGSKT